MRGWLAVPLSTLLAINARAQFPLLRSLELRDGQDRPAVNCLVQDASGLLWAGAEDGLFRTDGERVDVLFRTDGTRVTALEPWRDGVLAATSNGVVLRCGADRCDTLLVDTLLSNAAIRAICALNNGTVQLATYGHGVWILGPGRVQRCTAIDGLPDDHVNDLDQLPDGRVVVATDQGLAILHAAAVVKVLGAQQGAPDNLVLSVCVAPDGSVLAGTEARGAFQWMPDSDEVILLDHAWSGGQVNGVAMQGSNVWLASERFGVVMIDRSTTDVRYLQRVRPGGRPVHGLFIDHEGAAWWCEGTDLLFRADPAILVAPDHEGLDLRTVSALCIDRQERIWFATAAGLFHHRAAFAEGARVTRIPISIDPRTPIVSLAASDDGTIWGATFGSGIIEITPAGVIRRHSVSSGAGNPNVMAVRTHGNKAWFATLDGVVHWDGDRFDQVPGSSGFTFDVLPLPGDSLVVATDGRGILVGNSRGVRQVPIEQRTFYSLLRDAQGRVWAAGPGVGLCHLTRSGLDCSGAQRSAFSQDVFALGSASGRIAAFGSAGTVAFDPLNGAWSELGSRMGLERVQAQLNVVALARNGDLWYGCDQGLVRLRLSTHHFNSQLPVILTAFTANGAPLPVRETVELEHDRNDLVVRFTALFYADPSAVRFEYQVGGDGIIQRTRDRELALQDLRPGTHAVKIRAFVGEPGPHSAWRVLTVLVRDPWWRRPWVLGGTMVLLSATVWLLITARDRRLRYRERMEQEKVRFQLQALRSQIDPHFLFNSFNALMELIETDPPAAVHHVERLSAFFRNILLLRERDLIPLDEEIGLLRTYFELEQHRFGKAIDLLVRLEEKAGAQRIVPLTLQLLLENALKHNAATLDHPLVITVQATISEVVVENLIRTRTAARPSTGFGLQSIVQRYAMLTDRALHVHSDGTHFRVVVPLFPPDGHPDH